MKYPSNRINFHHYLGFQKFLDQRVQLLRSLVCFWGCSQNHSFQQWFKQIIQLSINIWLIDIPTSNMHQNRLTSAVLLKTARICLKSFYNRNMLFFWPNSPKREQHVNINTNKICLDLTLKYLSWTFSLPKFFFQSSNLQYNLQFQ